MIRRPAAAARPTADRIVARAVSARGQTAGTSRLVALAVCASALAPACASGLPVRRREPERPVALPTYADGATPSCHDVVMRVELVDGPEVIEPRAIPQPPGAPPPPHHQSAHGPSADAAPPSYVFDLTLRNPAASPRWLVVPRSFPRDGKDGPAPGVGAVTSLDADLQAGRGRATVVYGGGPGGFQAVLLPGGATVHLREVALEAPWDTTHAIARFSVVVARDFAVDDRDAASWFPSRTLTDPDADVYLTAPPRDRLATGLRPGDHVAAFTQDCRATAQTILPHAKRR